MKIKKNILKYKHPDTNEYIPIPVVVSGEDVSQKQDKTDNALVTKDKTIVGAINETNEKLKDLDVPAEVAIQNTQPTDQTLWINPNGSGNEIVLAEIDDDSVSEEKTWSSSKINEKIVQQEEQISNLGSIPSYVKTEAEEVANKVLSVRNADSFVMAIATDFHTNGNDISATGVKHAGQGIEEINSITQLDLIALLGDYEIYDLDDATDDNEDAKQSFKCVRKAFNEVSKNVPAMWLQGNHDILDTLNEAQARQQYYAFIGANNIGMVTDYDNKFRNYGYRDFENYKVRVIYLNSTDLSDESVTTSCYMSAEQLQWLVDVALQDLEEDWGIIALTHHPLNWESLIINLQNILNAFKGKASGSVTVSGTTVNYDFSNVKAEFIAHFHGHLHNFRTSVYGSNGVLSIAIPNACYDRNNEYGTASAYGETVKQAYGDVDENGNQRQFNKTINSANDTSFNVVVIDRVTKKIQAYCYGSGIDRELTYGEAEAGSSEILAITWNDNCRLSTSDGGIRTGAEGYTASEKIDLSLLTNIGDTLTVTGLSFDGTTYPSRSIAGFKDNAFITSYYPSTTTVYPIGDSGVTLMKTSDTSNTTVIFERTALNTDGKSYAIALCGSGSGANAVLTLEHK